MSTDAAAAQAIVDRALARFDSHRQQIWKATDRLFAILMLGQWAFAILLAVTFSPYGWEGKVRAVHVHVWVAVLLGGAISSLPIALALRRPGWVVTRHVIAAAQML